MKVTIEIKPDDMGVDVLTITTADGQTTTHKPAPRFAGGLKRFVASLLKGRGNA